MKVKVKLSVKKIGEEEIINEQGVPQKVEIYKCIIDFPYGYKLIETNIKEGYAIIELIRDDVYEKFKDKVLEVISE